MKNIIIAVVIIGLLIASYFFFFKKTPEQADLTSSTTTGPVNTNIATESIPVDTNFLTVILGVGDLNLNSGIFSDKAFNNLRDSSIILVNDGNEGRKNPFAQIGTDVILMPTGVNNSVEPNTTGTISADTIIAEELLPTLNRN